jgi:hypothetical protein
MRLFCPVSSELFWIWTPSVHESWVEPLLTKGEVKNVVPDAEELLSAAMQCDSAWLSRAGFLPFRLAVPGEIKIEKNTRKGRLVTVGGRIVRRNAAYTIQLLYY